MIESHLVDFKSLDLDPSSQRRNELMKGVASLFAFTSERCTLEQIEIYDDVLTRLARMVEREARAFASAKLAPLRRAPQKIIRTLAFDADAEVASPVLTQSPVLTEPDLLSIAEKEGGAHLRAIAGRSNLSEQLSDIVVTRGDEETRRIVAGNHGAILGENALSTLVEAAMTDASLAEALGGRADTPDGLIARIVAHAADEVRKTLVSKGGTPGDQRVDEAAKRATERMSNDYWLGRYDFETAWEKLLTQGGRSAASESLLCQFAIEDRFADVAAAFALLADLELEEATHWLVRTDTEPFVVIARAIGLRFTTVQALLKTGPWRHRLDQAARTAALNAFQAMDQRAARSRLSAWRTTRLAG